MFVSEIWGAYFREGLFIYLFIIFFFGGGGGGGYYQNFTLCLMNAFLKMTNGFKFQIMDSFIELKGYA